MELRSKDTVELVKVVDVRVKKVGDVTMNELVGKEDLLLNIIDPTSTILGLIKWKEDFKDWFNAKYAKPRARRKNGEIVGYECWCWDWDSWAKWCYENHKGNYTKGDWKGKDLTIYPDPFVELTTVKEVK